MSARHGTIPPEITHSFDSSDHRVRALVRRRDHFGGVNSISFLRYSGTEQPLMPKKQPGQWVVLRPHEPMTAGTLDAAKEMVRSLLDQVGSGGMDEQFEITPYRPSSPEGVGEREHSSGRIKAIILRHGEANYEVRYFLRQLLGVWQKSQTEEWDWVRTRWDIATFADTLPEAEQVAQVEMEQIVSEGEQTSIQGWFAWVGEKRPASPPRVNEETDAKSA